MQSSTLWRPSGRREATGACGRRRALLALAVLAMAGAGPAPAAGPATIELPGLDGTRHRVSDFLGGGRWTVVNIWGPRCPPCLEEMPELVGFHDDHADGRARVLGLALDFPSFGPARRDEVVAFVDDWFVSFPVLLTDASIMPRLTGRDLTAVPTTLIYGPDGALRAIHVGTVTQARLEAFIAREEGDAAAPVRR